MLYISSSACRPQFKMERVISLSETTPNVVSFEGLVGMKYAVYILVVVFAVMGISCAAIGSLDSQGMPDDFQRGAGEY
jgi:hypothetical protein